MKTTTTTTATKKNHTANAMWFSYKSALDQATADSAEISSKL
ncbi:MAG: hypothetical protein RBS07_18600 [Lentimicrobium sp.]|nr:hypothetical protein [Lentimicrobium sp.]